MSTKTEFSGTGSRGARVGVSLERSPAWRNFIEWHKQKAVDGWSRTTQLELATVMYPKPWKSHDRPSEDSSHKMARFREWAVVGLVVETGEHEQALNKVPTFAVGLTMKGVRACRDMGIRDVPMAVAATPPSGAVLTTGGLHGLVHDAEPEVVSGEDALRVIGQRLYTPEGRAQLGPPDEVKHARRAGLQNLRDSLTYAIWALDHEPKCERKHVDDLSSDQLFDLAVAKAKAGK